MRRDLTRSIKFWALLGAGSLGVFSSLIGIQRPAFSQVCNVFGCSQPGAGACNPFGCPNPGAGECTPFGCPASPPTNSNNSNSSQSSPNNSSRSFTIINNTNQAIQALFLSPATDSNWGANDINGNLLSGNSVSFRLTGDCRWDLLVRLSNSQTIQEMGIDTCLNSSYSVGFSTSQIDNNSQQPQQLRESFSQCVLDLYRGPYSARDAANNCLRNFQGNRIAPSESFSRCVLDLYRGPYSSGDAANNCLQAFQGNSANENLQTCISALYSGPYSSRDANAYCSEALRTF